MSHNWLTLDAQDCWNLNETSTNQKHASSKITLSDARQLVPQRHSWNDNAEHHIVRWVDVLRLCTEERGFGVT